MRIFYTSIFVLIFLIGLIFAVLNAQSVQLNYYFGTKEIYFSLALIVSMLIGAFIAALIGVFMMMRVRREVARLRKALQLAEKDINDLRNPGASTKT